MANTRNEIHINQLDNNETTDEQTTAIDNFFADSNKPKEHFFPARGLTERKFEFISDENSVSLFLPGMFKRPCTKGNFHFAVLADKPLAKGNSEVFEIAATFKKEGNKYVYKKKLPHPTKPLRIVKLKFGSQNSALQEYLNTIAANATFLRMKSPLFFDNHSYTIMDKLPGEDLVDYINRDREKNKPLFFTTLERIDMSIALLKALMVLHRFGTHRDIKPENIKILKMNGQYLIYFFDFETFLPKGEKSKDFCGTEVYRAPEILNGEYVDYRADDHSLAIILGLIFRADPRGHKDSASSYNFPGLFNNIHDFDPETKQALKEAIFKLYEVNRNLRASKEDTLKVFDEARATLLNVNQNNRQLRK